MSALPIELLAVLVSGGLCAFLLAWLSGEPWAWLHGRPLPATILAVPVLLAVYVLGRAVSTGVMGIADDRRWRGAQRDDGALNRRVGDAADREWSARLSGRILEAGALWLALSSIVLLGGGWLDWAVGQVAAWIGSTTLAAALGTATALLGLSADTSSGRGVLRSTSPRKETALRIVAPLTVLATLDPRRAPHLDGGRRALPGRRIEVVLRVVLRGARTVRGAARGAPVLLRLRAATPRAPCTEPVKRFLRSVRQDPADSTTLRVCRTSPSSVDGRLEPWGGVRRSRLPRFGPRERSSSRHA